MQNSTSDLSRLINPHSIALVGASDREGSIGERTLTNLITHSKFKGDLYLVNASKTQIRGHECWPSISALPKTPDVAVIAVPALSVVSIIEECAVRGVRFAVILSSGFGEAGAEGELAQQKMKDIAAASGLRLYGPNCPGLTNVNEQLGLTFSPSFPHDLIKGPIGLATQGGGLGRNVMQAMERGIGIGLWASTGNEVDLQVADFIHYMADAPDIKVIITLLEGIKDGQKFLAAVQRAALNGKPVIALKVGKSEYGQRAAQSHTASITGSAEVNSAIFKQFGVIEVDDIDELVDAAWLFARCLPAQREAIGIYCSSGGTAALTADAVGSSGLKLADFTEVTTRVLRENLPDYAAIGNPVDTTTVVLNDFNVVEKTLDAVVNDSNVGLVIVPIALDYGETTTRMAHNIINVQKTNSKPIVPIWMSDRQGEGYRLLVEKGFAPPRSVGKSIKAIKRWVEYGQWKRNHDDLTAAMKVRLEPKMSTDKKYCLSEVEAKSRLNAAGIVLLPNGLARTVEEACALADKTGYPVVAKIASTQIIHKSDVGGVLIGLQNAEQVESAWYSIMKSISTQCPDAVIDGLLVEKMAPRGGFELMIGITRDPVFGHMMTFGMGGIYVEIMKDVTRRKLPLTVKGAYEMVREIRCFPLLNGARGKPPADVAALEKLLLNISNFIESNSKTIEEMDLNPIWVGSVGEGAMPLDAVIIERRLKVDIS